MTRWILAVLAITLLSACSLAMLDPRAAREADVYARAVDRYAATGDLSLLRELKTADPESAWGARAGTVIALAERQQEQQARLQQEEKAAAACRLERDGLRRDNQLLEVTIERLKQVLVDMEMRAK